MSFLNDNDNDELDDSKKNNLVISQSRCLTRLNESMIELKINETSRRFIQKRVFIVFVIFHRDVARARKNKILQR